ncbi:MAG: hypothetical protein KatS3mg003_0664 [Candidatus Nitrosocaldaceae archaeon]|nr:MAG: hypothetical protein KatS3mg003_0664 [Candidatus Nitrosocaldaceae archaeon]
MKLRKLYGRKIIYTDNATRYHQACKWLRLKHIIYDINGKNVMERAIQYIKDRTECFDDNFPCMKDDCNMEHVIRWFKLFMAYLNVKIDLSRFLVIDGG